MRGEYRKIRINNWEDLDKSISLSSDNNVDINKYIKEFGEAPDWFKKKHLSLFS